MRFRLRKTVRLGPLKLHFNQRGFTGWGLGVGPWSWSATTGKHRIDTPGPGSVELGGRKRKPPRGGHTWRAG